MEEFTQIAYGGFVDNICETVDRTHTREEEDDDQPLLFDMGRVLKLGDGRRMPQRYSTIQHYDEWLAIDDQNVAAVHAANDRKHKVRELLEPYWPMGLSMERALEAYQAENPDADD